MKQSCFKKNVFANSKNESGILNKSAFTLIELLAIIVILAIIAVITVPIILNVIDNSKKGAAIDSAYGYKEAIYKGFLNDLTLDQNKALPTGVYIIDSTGKLVNSNGVVLNITISGTVPTEGWVELDKGNVIAYSLKFDDYVVTKYQDTEAEAVKNGEIAENVEAREARLESERQTRAIETAKGIASSQSGTTEIKDITDGWVAFINGELKAYSIKVTEGDYTYVVTDLDVDTSNSHAVADRTTSELASKSLAESIIKNYYSSEVATEVSNYIASVTTAANTKNYSSSQSFTVSEMANSSNLNVTNPGFDGSSWVYFTYDLSSNMLSATDYSIKVTKGEYTFVINCKDGNVSEPVESTTIQSKKVVISIEVIKAGSTLATGDIVNLKWGSRTEQFLVLLNDDYSDKPADTTALLAVEGINGLFYQKTNQYDSCVSSEYSQTKYWDNNVSYIYDASKGAAPGEDDFSIAYYVNNYVKNLQNLGFSGVQGGRILSKAEVDTGGIAEAYRHTGYYYWLGTITGFEHDNVYSIRDDGTFSDVIYAGWHGYRCTRPVIYIRTSDLQ